MVPGRIAEEEKTKVIKRTSITQTQRWSRSSEMNRSRANKSARQEKRVWHYLYMVPQKETFPTKNAKDKAHQTPQPNQ